MNTVVTALNGVAAARSKELAEQRMEELASTVRSNLEEAIEHYPRAGKDTFRLVWVLQGITNPTVLPVLQDAARHKDKLVRWAAVEGLKHFSDPGLRPLFEKAARDRAHLVKHVAREWLETQSAQQRAPADVARAADERGR